jgi:coenzyme PQQ precursor peptide PqqA
MKKAWKKPEIRIEATGMEVTSYEQTDIDSEILF